MSDKPARKSKKRKTAKVAAKPSAKPFMPSKLTMSDKPGREQPEEGPAGWFIEQIEATYARLMPASTASNAPIGAATHAAAPASTARRSDFQSRLQMDAGEDGLTLSPSLTWRDVLTEYKQRKSVAHTEWRRSMAPAAPQIPGARNWLPLGPTMVLNGQTIGNEPVGGRIAGLAVATGGALIYAAAACGGVFRSDDGGTTWRSLMDGFDVDPSNFASTSLACGAIALDPVDTDRVFVGTGEGDTHHLFSMRITNALPAYRGIGPIRTDDGGLNWVQEETAAGSAPLGGEAFFALAVDKINRETVIAATTAGLYQRRLGATGKPEWVQRAMGVHSSVVIAGTGTGRYFIAGEWGKGVVQSNDGTNWSTSGTGFPVVGVGRIALAVAASNPELVYALVATNNGRVHGVYRLDQPTGAWRKIADPPNILPSAQGDYDLAIAIDPADSNLVYLGGSYADAPAGAPPDWPWPGGIWRAKVKSTTANLAFIDQTLIGSHAHADIHVLVHSPNQSNELWCGCDGGVFLNRNPRSGGEFAGLNNGLSCLCSNFIAQHPTDPGIVFTGLQDNGTARTSGGAQWSRVNGGDGGYCVINWHAPNRVLCFANGRVYRSTSGGINENSWAPVWDFNWATMTQPIVTPPVDPARPGNADIVAVGAGSIVFISKDFGTSWPASGRIVVPGPDEGQVFALAFASADRLYIGTTTGKVLRADRSTTSWKLTRLENVPVGPLPLKGLITDIAIDWSDPEGKAIFITFGGSLTGDRRHVWRFNGTRWQERSGVASANPNAMLLDVEHNALVVDPAHPGHVYVGADIGIWNSTDGGLGWSLFQNGLPDAPIFDLQLHPSQRLLRAATHGRGVYEFALPD